MQTTKCKLSENMIGGKMSLSKINNYMITVTSVIVFYILSNVFVNGELTTWPTDSEILVGQSTYFNCSTSIFNQNIHWYFIPIGKTEADRENVYVRGKMDGKYANKFWVDRLSEGVCNLVIPSTMLGDAGRYDCIDDGGYGESKSAELIVLATNLVCKATSNTTDLIGPNDCGIEPETLRQSCSVSYNGTNPPNLEWKSVGANESLMHYVTTDKSAKFVTYNLEMKANLSINGSSFICQTTRSASEQYNCTTGTINVLYAFSGNLTMNVSVNDEVVCAAKSTQVCNYKWKWISGDDITTESDSAVLIAKKPGWHKCEAQCNIKAHPCAITVMMAHVNYDAESSANASATLNVAIPVVLIVVVAALIAVAICMQKRKRTPQGKANALLKKEKPHIKISAAAIFNGEIYTIRQPHSSVEIFDNKGKHRHSISIHGVVDAYDMIISKDGIYMYILDRKLSEKPNEIFQVRMYMPRAEDMDELKIWKTEYKSLCTISAAYDSNVLVCSTFPGRVIEYSCNGDILREISFAYVVTRNPMFCMKLSKQDYLISCHNKYYPAGMSARLISLKLEEGEVKRDLHIVEKDNRLTECFQVSSGIIECNLAFDVDKDGLIYVPDEMGNRVIILDSNYKKLDEFEVLTTPFRLWLDEKYKRVFVWGLDAIAVCMHPFPSGSKRVLSQFKLDLSVYKNRVGVRRPTDTKESDETDGIEESV